MLDNEAFIKLRIDSKIIRKAVYLTYIYTSAKAYLNICNQMLMWTNVNYDQLENVRFY